MEARKLLDILTIAERLKDTTRHCYTAKGRHESVAEHSWMMTLMAFLMRDEFEDVDMDKVIKMCIIHDLGECFTGDIPTFEKNEYHEKNEKLLLDNWLSSLPLKYASEMKELFKEMEERQTIEAKVFKSIDSLEALIQHNISDISTWIPLEYDLNMTYADDKVEFSSYLKILRQSIREDSIKKIEEEKALF
ncbi:MAG: HD domain-containing protein [Sarcina sp.]